MANRLAHETSPYLLQHKDNPVDWYPWGAEALAKARAEDRPILLSIGYSACHWCHVMEHESFEDPETARLMNELFVNIKVDREERPDLDSIYMAAVQAMAGHGGWPLTVFLTPEGVPFYGGTYFPPEDRHGLPSFRRVLVAVAEAYRHRRDEVVQNAERLREFLQAPLSLRTGAVPLTPALLDAAARKLKEGFDHRHAGFGGAPKFPQPMNLEFLLRHWRRTGDAEALAMVERTLQAMARGGVYDQIGGGFHRYSVDAGWLVPHFEKMLYDNALLARLYLEAFQATHHPFYQRIARETLAYLEREMLSPEGGFYSTQDADSEGEEGKFYLWTPAELREVLGEEEARVAAAYWDVTDRGNFEGRSILNVPREAAEVARSLGISVEELEARLARARPRLYAARERRVHPGRDEKILTAWNGLALRAFAEAAVVLDQPAYAEVARRTAEFLLSRLRQNGRLLRTYKDGRAHLNGYLEDYACLADGLLALYQATFDLRWFREARALTDAMLALFWDEEQGGFFDTAVDHESLIARPRDLFDNATPAGNSVATDVLLRLALYTGEARYQRRAAAVLHQLALPMRDHPGGFGRLLCALDFDLSTPKEIAIAGDPASADTHALLRVVHERYHPNKIVALATDGSEAAAEIPLLADRPRRDGRATAYVCERYVCQQPATDPEALAAQLA